MKTRRHCKGPCACPGWCYFDNDLDFDAWRAQLDPKPKSCKCICHNYTRHPTYPCVICNHMDTAGTFISTTNEWYTHEDLHIQELQTHWQTIKHKYLP